jgi:hypothetical protein
VIVSVLIYLLAGLSSGRNYLWLITWVLIVGTILISAKKYLWASKAKDLKLPNTAIILKNIDDEKEVKSIPSRIIQIPSEKLRKKDHHLGSASGANPTPPQTASEDQKIE